MDRTLAPQTPEQRKKELEFEMKYSGPGIRGTGLGLISIGAGMAHGSMGAGLRTAGKVAKPVAAGVMVLDAARLAGNPQARQIATKTAEDRTKAPALVRAGKAALDPVNTIYGVASQAKEAVRSWRNADAAGKAYQEAKKRFDARQAARQAQR